MQSESPRAQVDVPFAILVIGSFGLVVGIGSIFASVIAYSCKHDFSFLATYISEFGSTAGWPQAIFTSGMLIAAPLRYLFLFLLLTQLVQLGSSQRFRSILLAIGAFVVLGSVGTAAVPYTLHLTIHKCSALIYFFGTVILQTALAIQERRLRLPALLPLSSMAVVVLYFVFATLLALVGKVEGIDRATPALWEWLCFAALMIWLAVHTAILGARRVATKGSYA